MQQSEKKDAGLLTVIDERYDSLWEKRLGIFSMGVFEVFNLRIFKYIPKYMYVPFFLRKIISPISLLCIIRKSF